MKIEENDTINQMFEHWMNVTLEPSFNQTEIDSLHELAICIVDEKFALSDEDFIKRVKKKFLITKKHHRGDAQKFLRILKEDISFYRYLLKINKIIL